MPFHLSRPPCAYILQSCGIKKHPRLGENTLGPCVEIASRLVCSQDFGKPPTSLLIGRSLSAFLQNRLTLMSAFCLLDKLPARKNQFPRIHLLFYTSNFIKNPWQTLFNRFLISHQIQFLNLKMQIDNRITILKLVIVFFIKEEN